MVELLGYDGWGVKLFKLDVVMLGCVIFDMNGIYF